MTAAKPKPKTIAIIGGGITGATAAQTLSNHDNLTIHVFDQGRRGVGGRTSSRSVITTPSHDGDGDGSDIMNMRWDHGCQFFRADTPQFQEIIRQWMMKDIVREWEGKFVASSKTTLLSADGEFFGLPSAPPFYVGWDGMQSIAQSVLNDVNRKLTGGSSSSSSLKVFTGTRVAHLERCGGETQQKWKLYGTSGMAAYHDTSESFVQITQDGTHQQQLGDATTTDGYDAIILTDVSSSSFGKWHRASAGVPDEFAQRVRERVGARVPLFTAMIAFDTPSNIPFDAASFDDGIVWFAAKSNSKPGMEDDNDHPSKECWTIVSTPEYAMAQIEETPMQDAKTGEFIPQSNDYLTNVPGPDLFNAFTKLLCEKGEDGNGILGDDALDNLPEVVHMDAQRWGSALPCHRHLDDTSLTRKIIGGVPYDSGITTTSPQTHTSLESKHEETEDWMAR